MVGRSYEEEKERVMKGVEKKLKELGWKVIERDVEKKEKKEIRFDEKENSFIMGMKRDIVIRMMEEGEKKYVDMS